MLSSGFSRWLAASGFERRATPAPGGRIIYALADGSGHVELDAGQWEAFGERFAGEARAVTRRANWLYGGLLPSVLLYALTLGQIIRFSGIVILVAILGGPLAIYLWQSHRMKAIAARIEADLAHRPSAAAPPVALPRLPRWLEIAAALLAGPHLILEVYGSLNPDAFRNTPWMGTHLDWSGVAAFLVLATIFVLRRRMDRAGRTVPRPPAPGRGSDFVVRAREQAP